MVAKEQVPSMGQEVQNGLQIFNNPSFGEVRVTILDGEPYFVGTDVARALGYAKPNNAIATHLNENERKVLTYKACPETGKATLWDGNDFSNKTLITESGLYALIFGSNLPQAQDFRYWVTSEVLPSIRRKGGYLATMPDDNPETIMARAILIAQEKIKEQAQIIEEQKGWMQLLSAKADYTTQVLQSESTYTFTQIAKELGMSSAVKLLKSLHEKGIIYKASKQWVPYAKFSEKGYFATRTAKFLRSNETIGTSISTVVTEKGRCWLNYLYNKFNNNQKSA